MSVPELQRLSYREYVADDEFQSDYAAYQQRWASEVRQSDRVLIELVRELAAQADRPLRVLDVGCSTGNLLLHLKHEVPGLELVGGDMVPSILEDCRRDPNLAGIRFEELDLLDLGCEGAYDVVVVNAVLYLFSDEEYERALASAGRALAPGGTLLVYDFFHPFEQDLTILERSATHPEGLVLHFRPISWASAALDRAGFAEAEFRPFEIPIELPRPDDDAYILSYTRPSEGRNLLFRGTLFQPWCHLVARKRG